MPTTEIRIEGPDADAAADSLAQLFERSFGQRPERRPAGSGAAVLAVPTALFQPMDLADRLERLPKMQALVTWAEAQAAAGCAVFLVLPDAPPLRLAGTGGDQVMDAAAQAASV